MILRSSTGTYNAFSATNNDIPLFQVTLSVLSILVQEGKLCTEIVFKELLTLTLFERTVFPKILISDNSVCVCVTYSSLGCVRIVLVCTPYQNKMH
jgi:hypothetical protein